MNKTPAPALVISLDVELGWGLGPKLLDPFHPYWCNIRRAAEAAHTILELFIARGIHATWATVGLVCAEGPEEARLLLPDILPIYSNQELNNYRLLENLPLEENAACFFAPDLVDKIISAKGQELGSHSFSHYYCNDPCQGDEAFMADIRASQRIAKAKNIRMRSFVFPRNQVNNDYLHLLPEAGFDVYRGRGPASSLLEGFSARWAHKARSVDRYINLTGHAMTTWQSIICGPPANVAASRFLGAVNEKYSIIDPLRCNRIIKDIEQACLKGQVYHLWWHPHNFGRRLNENIRSLMRILDAVATFRVKYGLQSLTMCEAAEVARNIELNN